jgi:cation transport regulator ChaC
VEMDNAVAAAYGWSDLDLGHGFHETKQGVRYTISEPARREVLARLLKLNHERYAEEVRQGLHDKKKAKAGKSKKKAGAVLSGAALFDKAETNTDVWYFAYGSNLWIDQKQDRTGLIRSGDERPRLARLADYRLAFNKQGRGGGVFANIMPCPGEQVIGVAYRCSPATLDTMSEYEIGYERQVVTVALDDGPSIEAVTYVAMKGSVVDDACPSPPYLERIVKGAAQHGLPEDYIEKIRLLGSAREESA